MNKREIIELLKSEGSEREHLRKLAHKRKLEIVGKKVFFRGLVEFSNCCSKDCFYCGIRKSNRNIVRYDISDHEIIESCKFAYENNFGSVVLQSGELSSKLFVNRVNQLIKKIKQISNGELGITLSCGEQTKETYRKWFESGAHRYLLRIESSNEDLYKKIHPATQLHSFASRLKALYELKDTGYQLGTGVMIGLPFQTFDDLASDLLFFKENEIDMCGMGPFIEHEETPLWEFRNQLMSKNGRFELTLNMIAVLRLLMPDINISATTALQAIDPDGREKALFVGANIIMPNITPKTYRQYYKIYENKPFTDADALSTLRNLVSVIKASGCEIGFGEWGDSKHFSVRTSRRM